MSDQPTGVRPPLPDEVVGSNGNGAAEIPPRPLGSQPATEQQQQRGGVVEAGGPGLRGFTTAGGYDLNRRTSDGQQRGFQPPRTRPLPTTTTTTLGPRSSVGPSQSPFPSQGARVAPMGAYSPSAIPGFRLSQAHEAKKELVRASTGGANPPTSASGAGGAAGGGGEGVDGDAQVQAKILAEQRRRKLLARRDQDIEKAKERGALRRQQYDNDPPRARDRSPTPPPTASAAARPANARRDEVDLTDDDAARKRSRSPSKRISSGGTNPVRLSHNNGGNVMYGTGDEDEDLRLALANSLADSQPTSGVGTPPPARSALHGNGDDVDEVIDVDALTAYSESTRATATRRSEVDVDQQEGEDDEALLQALGLSEEELQAQRIALANVRAATSTDRRSSGRSTGGANGRREGRGGGQREGERELQRQSTEDREVESQMMLLALEASMRGEGIPEAEIQRQLRSQRNQIQRPTRGGPGANNGQLYQHLLQQQVWGATQEQRRGPQARPRRTGGRNAPRGGGRSAVGSAIPPGYSVGVDAEEQAFLQHMFQFGGVEGEFDDGDDDDGDMWFDQDDGDGWYGAEAVPPRGGGRNAGGRRQQQQQPQDMSYEALCQLEDVATPLPPSIVAKIPTEVFKDSSLTEEEKADPPACPICLMAFENDDVVATLPDCFHQYHSDCVEQWFKQKRHCCVCKKEVGSEVQL